METDYRRVLVAVDLTPASRGLVAAARAIAPRAKLEVVHVLGTSGELLLRELDAPAATLRAYRGRRVDAARRALVALLPGDSLDVACTVEFGRAADRIRGRARSLGADLVVLGRRPRGLLARLLAGGGTARAVLAAAPCDVLVLPAPLSDASRPAPLRPAWRPAHSAPAS